VNTEPGGDYSPAGQKQYMPKTRQRVPKKAEGAKGGRDHAWQAREERKAF
jgi:hypothetical protein